MASSSFLETREAGREERETLKRNPQAKSCACALSLSREKESLSQAEAG